MAEKRDKLSFKPAGDVANLEIDFGWCCGKANPGIHIGFEEYQGKNILFRGRGGVLTKKQVKTVIKYLQKYVDKCDVEQKDGE